MIQSLTPGSTVRGTYTILEKLGEGAFSEVFLVRHRFLGLQAMKVFKSDSLSPAFDQFKEAFILSRIAHPNIVRIFEANTIDGLGRQRSYVTMEHAAGGTLHSFLNSRPHLSPKASIRVQKQICAGLSAAHSQKPPIIHRDVKPQNILLTDNSTDPAVKVADFGLAKNIDPKLRMVSAAGTLLYMPPEGFHHYETAASDVYSAGIIFYQMLTGVFPFTTINYTTEQEFRLALAKSRTHLPKPPSQIAPGISINHDGVSLGALQPDMRKRFQSASEFLAALNTLESASSIPPTPHVPDDGKLTARMKIEKAIQMGKQYTELPMAIELMEEALLDLPSLASQYRELLAKWKSGVVL